MGLLTVQIPQEYGYVLLTVVGSVFVNSFHGIMTGKARKSSGIGYPNAYATAEQAEKNPEAYRLNCAQRAHANFTENLVTFLPTLLIAGLRFPTYAAVAATGWLTCRVAYTQGYVAKGPQGRVAPSIASYLFLFPLLGMAGTTCYKMITGQ
ncbi:hypothetical protein BD289DRAFT_442931 [Coniella lustricola]|uniref:Membrane-associated proteins in eicosanoid and glutathione metabolism n=1 Tax=Coniella lustricola TaxID=2025994 RepID=A0A2T2ZXN1_9PEZI|nr:hypothetical protein BD289DRAFT_442931 [Coniella lustricola]